MELAEPLKEWLQVRDMATHGISLASPTAIGKDAQRIYSNQQRAWEERMQLAAFGEGFTDPNFDRARTRAADILVSDGEKLVQSTVGQMLDAGADPRKIVDVASTPVYRNPESVEDFSLEQLSSENEREDTLKDNPEVMEQESLGVNQELGDIADIFTKQKILGTMALKLENAWEKESFWEGTKQFAVDMIPFADRFINTFAASGEEESTLTKLKRAITPGEREREIQGFYLEQTKDMTVEEFAKLVQILPERMKERGFSTERIRRFFDTMSGGTSWVEKLALGGDLVGVKPTALKGIANIFTDDAITKVSKKLATGNTKAATKEAQDAIASLAAKVDNLGKEAEEVVSGAIDSGFQANKELGSVSKKIEDDVLVKISEGRFRDTISNTISTDLKTAEEKAAEAASTQRSIINSLKGTKEAEIHDFNIVENFDGSRDVIAKIGTGKDGTTAFATEEAAKRWLNSTTLLEGEATIAREADGFYVYAQRPVTNLPVDIDKWTNEFKGVPFLRHIFGAVWVPNEIRGINLVAEGGARQLKNEITRELKAALKGVNRKELKNLQALITQGQIQEVWYKPEWLKETGAFSDKAVDLYNLYREASDANYSVMNKYWRRKLHDSGVRLIEHTEGGRDKYMGTPVESLEHPEKYIFKDIDTGQVYDTTRMSKALMEDLQSKGKKVIKLRNAVRDADGQPYQFVISGNLRVSNLPDQIIPYVAGGTKYYPKGTVFVKQANVFTKNNVDSLFRSRTLAAHLNKREALQQAQEVNDALALYRRHLAGELSKDEFGALINEQTAANRFFKATGADDFEKYIKSEKNPTGWLDHRFDLEVLEDGQASSIYSRMKAKGAIAMEEDITNVTEDAFDLMRDYTESYIMHRGEQPLKDLFGNYATTINFVDAIQRTADRTADLAVTRPWVSSWARYIRKYFGDIINADDLARMSDKDLILYSRTIPNPSNDITLAKKLSAFKYARSKFEIVAKTPTAYDRWIKAHMKWLADTLGDSKWAEKIGLFQRGTWSYKKLLSLEPVSFGRALAYQMYMGFFSPRQLWLQGMGAKTVIDLEPFNAAKALSSYMPVSAAVMTKDASKLAFLRKAAGTLGTDAKTFDDMVEYLRQVGVRSGIERAYTGYAGYGTALEQASTWTARTGEGFNQMLAHQTSFRKFYKELTQAANKEARDAIKRKMAVYADELAMNMNRLNDTAFQRTPGLNILAQFQNWGIRNFEVLASKNLSAAQKARLELSNLMFFGVDGTLGRHSGFWVYDMLHEDYGWSPEAAQWVETAASGALLDPLGVNVSSGGPQIFDLAEKIYDLFTGEGSEGLLDYAPSVQALMSLKDTPGILSQVITTIGSMMSLESVPDEQLYNNLYSLITKKQPSSFSRAEKAILASQTGYLLNGRGDIVNANTDKTKAILYGLGMDLNEEAGTDYMYWKLGKNKKAVKEIMNELRKDWRDWRMTGSEDLGITFWNKVQAYTSENPTQNPAVTRALREQIGYLLRTEPTSAIQKRVSMSFWAKSKGYKEFYDLLEKPTITVE